MANYRKDILEPTINHVEKAKTRLKYIGLPVKILDAFKHDFTDFVDTKDVMYRLVKSTREFIESYFTIKSGAEIPFCTHPHWESIIVIRGEVQEKVNGITLKSGDILVIPPNTRHHIVSIKDWAFIKVNFAKRKELLNLEVKPNLYRIGDKNYYLNGNVQ